MTGKLTTHVLDMTLGLPAPGMKLRLFRLEASGNELLLEAVTNHDGRLEDPLLEGEAMQRGEYELVFDIGAYFSRRSGGEDIPCFLTLVPIRFRIEHPEEHYHVPLLAAPGGYSTYRGS